MAKKFNLDSVKNEIDTRRQAKGQAIQEATGGGRDALLGDLVTSLNSGAPSKAVQKMKLVEGVSNSVGVAATDGAGGAVITQKANSGIVAHQQPQTPQQPANAPPQQLREGDQPQGGMMPEREDLYDNQVNNLINQYRTGTPAAQPYGYPQQPYGQNGTPYLNEQQMLQMASQQQQQPVQGQPPMQGGNVLGEHVSHAVDGFMNEHFGGIVQEAMKNTIIEMYSVERVKKTLDENRDMIRNIVVDVIKELQQRKAANSGK